ncbi:hypothetical protein P7C70_g3852, partial [Phenoliferia sp. Uapishka_3]
MLFNSVLVSMVALVQLSSARPTTKSALQHRNLAEAQEAWDGFAMLITSDCESACSGALSGSEVSCSVAQEGGEDENLMSPFDSLQACSTESCICAPDGTSLNADQQNCGICVNEFSSDSSAEDAYNGEHSLDPAKACRLIQSTLEAFVNVCISDGVVGDGGDVTDTAFTSAGATQTSTQPPQAPTHSPTSFTSNAFPPVVVNTATFATTGGRPTAQPSGASTTFDLSGSKWRLRPASYSLSYESPSFISPKHDSPSIIELQISWRLNLRR